jgi:hypothetical protein
MAIEVNLSRKAIRAMLKDTLVRIGVKDTRGRLNWVPNDYGTERGPDLGYYILRTHTGAVAQYPGGNECLRLREVNR